MANKLDRIEKDIQKVKSKIAEYNKQLRELEGLLPLMTLAGPVTL